MYGLFLTLLLRLSLRSFATQNKAAKGRLEGEGLLWSSVAAPLPLYESTAGDTGVSLHRNETPCDRVHSFSYVFLIHTKRLTIQLRLHFYAARTCSLLFTAAPYFPPRPIPLFAPRSARSHRSARARDVSGLELSARRRRR